MSAKNANKYRPEQSDGTDQTEYKNNFMQKEDTSQFRLKQLNENNIIDSKYGFEYVTDNSERTGFLLNMHASEVLDQDKRLVAAVDFYFMEEDGTRFKVAYPFKPYFYILTQPELLHEVTLFLSKKFSGSISGIEVVTKEDLDLPNHLIGLKRKYLKLSFFNQTDLIKTKNSIRTVVNKNIERQKADTYYTEMLTNALASNADVGANKVNVNHLENIIDIREHDVPYHTRVSIDLKVFCGCWYTVKGNAIRSEVPTFTSRKDIIERPEPIVLAFDIETTKMPLKFPDAETDQIMMISYMIDGLGYLITNREILSSDIEDFEYSPNPEFEGKFTIFNEANEKTLIEKFFDHILEVRPHIFVTYNGDFFDWKFIEARAAFYELDMRMEIGFSKSRNGDYVSRPAMHMDCLCWVKRDSYLPIGSQGLKAVAKAKLRYDPVEIDPEEMCPLAVSQPQVMANYSVSDAVATYYLYMKYVHPFIFALCTIIPSEPDEVLRKGSGTLCEALLMVEAFHANIIFPNKEETVLNKLTDDGHVLHQETYIGGHVEALESGVFRADIPCRFRLIPEALDKLISQVPKTLAHAIEVEEGIPLDSVTNLDEVTGEIVQNLASLKENPLRLEKPLIIHLDVGAMYPNIILTNRLQPCAVVDKSICAACNFNKPGADCQRHMHWMQREEYMPASRNEYNRIQQQLETEKFPPQYPGGPMRAFHQLPKKEQAEFEKKRLSTYCQKVYKKQKEIRIKEQTTTICQKENSFYVDTVRAFRDRRYEYKGLSKKAKQQVVAAIKGGDASEIKSARNREILYDSLQLAHKCILNSFYGYVMRKGSRWYSMEMAGIVCHTGSNIIRKAREIIEQVGRPLELDTDGIWCILPATFPENVTVYTTNASKQKVNVSYPNAVLNAMLKENFTNNQYYELVNPETLEYVKKSENSIFFEIDGPYKAMVLPASKEEGKKLKKRYAVFNFDGSLAELKGFEVKRRGELQLIKNFQSSVFEAFLKGDSLESCYAAVAQVADYWLDVLFSHGKDMPDCELFELISENRSMSKKLEEYGSRKSTSITTAKRLAEFLGDEMVKDKNLACKNIIAKKPDGAPVTARAIPLAIFQAEEAVQKHFLRRWLKDNSISHIDIRDILDWDYYIERLSGSIQKIITIPAAKQGVANPVPRVKHPAWLHKKILEKNDPFKQRQITDMFSFCSKEMQSVNDGNVEKNVADMEDFGTTILPNSKQPIANVNKRKRGNDRENEFDEEDLTKSWRDVLGKPPSCRTQDFKTWILFHKKKWRFQALQRNIGQPCKKKSKTNAAVVRSAAPGTLGSFLQRAQQTLLINAWHILQIVETSTPGEFKLWALVQSELHLIKLIIPRMFYANLLKPKCANEGSLFKKCNRTLPRLHKVHNLYLYTVPEEIFQEHGKKIFIDLSDPDVEGVYETQVTLIFRALLHLGCLCNVVRGVKGTDSFLLQDLEMCTKSKLLYLPKDAVKHLYLYHHRAASGPRQMFALFITPLKKAIVIVVDSVRTNLMPNMVNIYQAERIVKKDSNVEEEFLPPENIAFEIRVEVDLNQAYKLLDKALKAYKDEKKGPTLLAIQSQTEPLVLQAHIPTMGDFPFTQIHVHDIEELYNSMEWQKIGAKTIIRHYLNSEEVLDWMVKQCRYFHLPVGNMPSDSTIFGADLFFARHLVKNNNVLWFSTSDRPDLGGSQEVDARLLAESQEESSEICNVSGWYSSVCVELNIDSLAINTLLQSHHVTDIEGMSEATAFDGNNQTSIDDIVSGNSAVTTYDETARCTEAFRCLRAMAIAWMLDVSQHRNVFADLQVIHFYRWLRSPKALLYDPALLRRLQNLMKKLFIQLVAEFKRLGCIIVYANFNKIVICSKKQNVQDAVANVEFVVASIHEKELFHSLHISYRHCWELLVWLDPANFAAIKGKFPEGIENSTTIQDESQKVSEEEDDGPVVVLNFNIAEQLPETAGCRNSFNTVVAGYINAIYNKLKQTANHSVLSAQILSQPSLGLAEHEDVVKFAKEIISGEISQKLFQLVEKIDRRFPAKPGTDDSLALKFIKAICHIFSLDPAVSEAVYELKSNLLRLIGVGEFSEKAVWRDTTVSFVIPQLICKLCNHCRDVDLGRDSHRTDSAWLCPLCDVAYDNTEIESFLLDVTSRKFLAYNLQDLQCKKCRQIKMENLIKLCKCAGQFQELISRTELIQLLETFLKLADKFEMFALKETVEQIFTHV